MADRVDPYMQSGFRVEIGGIIRTEFIECTFADTSTEPPTARKLSGLSEYGNITLKWGITDSMELYGWRKQVIDTGA